MSNPAQPEHRIALSDIAQWRQDFLAKKTANSLRQRDAAHAMGVSEGEALAAFVGEHVVRLQPRFMTILGELPQLGKVMALTRNEAAVHEKDGQYEDVTDGGHVGLVLGSAIDLRVFHRSWGSVFAAREPGGAGELKSLQFFDQHGQAVHKVFLRAHSDHAAYDALVARWAEPDQTPGLAVNATAPVAPTAATKPDADIDVDGFLSAWDAMQDTHEFFGVLRRFGLARTQALRLAGARRALPVSVSAARTVLESAAASGLPIMVFVGNPGMIQIHTGPVHQIRVMGPWLNVLDPEFNLHLRADLIDTAWVVRKPTADGIVTSLELFDANGENIAMLFGARKPGKAELAGWRTLAASLPARPASDTPAPLAKDPA